MASSPRWLQTLPWLSAALPFAWIAARGFPAGDDWQLELARVAAYLDALRDGQWPPFWAPSLYAGHGSPVFLFYGHAFLALASAGVLAAGSCGGGFVLGLALASGLGVVLTQRAAAGLVQAPPEDAARAGRMAACLFVASPYLLADLLLRNAAAEYVALCCLPLLLAGVSAVGQGARRGWLQVGVGMALVLVSHVLVGLMASVLVVPIAFARVRGKQWLGLLAGGALGAGLAAFHLLPLSAYRDLLNRDELLQGKFAYAQHLGSLLHVFDPREAYAASLLPLLLALGAALGLTRRTRSECESAAISSRTALALSLAVGVCALLQTPLAQPCLALVPGLAYLQFPFRWNGPLALAAALLAAALLTQLMAAWTQRHKRLLELAVWLACLLAAWPQLERMRVPNGPERSRFEAMLAPENMPRALITATVGDEYLPRGAHRQAVHAPALDEPVLSAGEGTRVALRRVAPRELSLVLRADRPIDLCLARWSFPFWRVLVDDQPQGALACADGHLRVPVAAGKHTVQVSLPLPAARALGLWISGAALVLLLACALRTRRSTGDRSAARP